MGEGKKDERCDELTLLMQARDAELQSVRDKYALRIKDLSQRRRQKTRKHRQEEFARLIRRAAKELRLLESPEEAVHSAGRSYTFSSENFLLNQMSLRLGLRVMHYGVQAQEQAQVGFLSPLVDPWTRVRFSLSPVDKDSAAKIHILTDRYSYNLLPEQLNDNYDGAVDPKEMLSLSIRELETKIKKGWYPKDLYV